MGQIAEILQTRGELDEVLRIRREEQLPVYERLGDVRGKAVTRPTPVRLTGWTYRARMLHTRWAPSRRPAGALSMPSRDRIPERT
jgi:hypothetical protein